MRTIFYCILVLFLPAQLFATQVNDFVSVNITFLDSLKGPVKDAVVFKNWSDSSGVGSLNLSDADISDGKKGILDQIRQFVKDKPNVNFNYSGHGARREITAAVYGPNIDSKGQPCDPQTAVTDCKPSVITPAVYQYFIVSGPLMKCMNQGCVAQLDPKDLDLEAKCIQLADRELSAFTGVCYRPFYACLEKKALEKVSESEAMEACGKFDADCKNNPIEKRLTAERDSKVKLCKDPILTQWNKCQDNCFEKFAITDKDLAEIFQDKKVFGIIDACHSDGIAKGLNLKNQLYLSSAAEDELAQDTKEGGALTLKLERYLSQKFCEIQSDQPGIDSLKLFRQMEYATNNYNPNNLPKKDGYLTSQRSVLNHQGSGFEQIILKQSRTCSSSDGKVNPGNQGVQIGR